MSDADEVVKADPVSLDPPPAILKIVTQALRSLGEMAEHAGIDAATMAISLSQSSIKQAAVISNRGGADLTHYIRTDPSSGRYWRGPPKTVPSVPTALEAFQLWQKSPEAPPDVKESAFADLTEAWARLLAQWICSVQSGLEVAAPYYVLASSGAGVEGVTLYEAKLEIRPGEAKTEDAVFVIYLNNPFIGSTEAGGFITSKRDFIQTFGLGGGQESNVIDYIQDKRLYSSDKTVTETFVPGWSLPSYAYEMTFTAREVTSFKLHRSLKT